MRSLIKFPLIALLFLAGIETAVKLPAMAGSAGVTLPGSGSTGVDGTVSPGQASPEQVAAMTARVSNSVNQTIRSIGSRGSVQSANGRDSLPISGEKLEVIVAAATARGVESRPALVALEQQLSAELGGLELSVESLSASPDNLGSAIETVNEMIMSLNSEQLALAIQSPTLMTLLRALGGANQALEEGGTSTEVVESSGLGILQLSLL